MGLRSPDGGQAKRVRYTDRRVVQSPRVATVHLSSRPTFNPHAADASLAAEAMVSLAYQAVKKG